MSWHASILFPYLTAMLLAKRHGRQLSALANQESYDDPVTQSLSPFPRPIAHVVKHKAWLALRLRYGL
jgi:hypothetical protein